MNYDGEILDTGFPRDLTARDTDTSARSNEYPAAREYGAYAELRPTDELTRNFSGSILRTYFDDYYNRTWLIPFDLPLGTISSDVSATVILWNARFGPVTVVDVALTGLTSGLGFTGPTRPAVIGPLAITRFYVTLSEAGDPTVDATIVFSTSDDEILNLTVSGRRAFMWDMPFWPNWASPVKIVYEFKTEITTSRGGFEQRVAHRQTPRKTIEFEVLQFDAQTGAKRRFRDLLRRAQNRTFVLPEFPRRAFLAEDALAVNNFVVLESIPDWIYPGRLVLIQDGVSSRLLTVQSIVGSTVAFLALVGADWDMKTTRLNPAVTCYLGDSVSGRVHLPTISGHSISARQFPGDEEETAFSEGEAGPLFDGREIFPFTPNWKSELTLETLWPTDVNDYGVGTLDRFQIIDFPIQTLKMQFWDKGFAEADKARQFFTRMRGSQREFFCPTFENDIVVSEIAHAGLNRLRVSGLDVYATYLDSPAFVAIIIYQANGNRIVRKVSQVLQITDSLGADSAIEFTEALPEDVGGSNTHMISWLMLARFGTDLLSVGWETIDLAQYDIAIHTLRYAEAETLTLEP